MASTTKYESLEPTAGLGTNGVAVRTAFAAGRVLAGGAARAFVEVFWASTAQGARKATMEKQTANQRKFTVERLRERVISTTPYTEV